MDASNLTEQIMIIRLVLSFLAGTCIGMERSGKRQIAGLRTHILICMGACAMMLVSLWVSSFKPTADPARIAAQVVSGIGFLGAGAILKIGANIKGLTTAASIWVVAGIGLSFGCGLYILASVLTGLSLLTLSVVNIIELKLFPSRQNKFLQVYFKGDEPPVNALSNIFFNYSISVISTNVRVSKSNDELSEIVFFITMPKNIDVKKLTKEIETIDKIDTIILKEKTKTF